MVPSLPTRKSGSSIALRLMSRTRANEGTSKFGGHFSRAGFGHQSEGYGGTRLPRRQRRYIGFGGGVTTFSTLAASRDLEAIRTIRSTSCSEDWRNSRLHVRSGFCRSRSNLLAPPLQHRSALGSVDERTRPHDGSRCPWLDGPLDRRFVMPRPDGTRGNSLLAIHSKAERFTRPTMIFPSERVLSSRQRSAVQAWNGIKEIAERRRDRRNQRTVASA